MVSKEFIGARSSYTTASTVPGAGITLLLEAKRTPLFPLFIRVQTEDMSIACSSWHGGTNLGDNGHNVAAGCQGWERDPGKEVTSKASNTKTATSTPYPLLSLFYKSN